MIPREDVAAAVFALTAPLSNLVSPAGPFVTRSRRIIPITQVTAAQMPALFQMQDEESILQDMRQLGGGYASVMRFWWIVYAAASPDAASVPSSVLNPLVDAVIGVLPPMNVPFEIDGDGVVFGWDEGRVNYIEGIVAGASVAEIPIYVKVPLAS